MKPDYENEIDDFSFIGRNNITSNEEKIMEGKFDFIYSTRFWSLVIGAVSIYLKAKGIIGEPEMLLIATITSGFIVVKTADRMSEQKVLAAEATGKVTTVTMPDSVNKVTASTEDKSVERNDY